MGCCGVLSLATGKSPTSINNEPCGTLFGVEMVYTENMKVVYRRAVSDIYA
jgi:hypothetical protein